MGFVKYDLVVTMEHSTVLVFDKPVVLQPCTHQVLLFLAANARRVVSVGELYQYVWGRHGRVVEPGQLSLQIGLLRRVGLPIVTYPKYGFSLMLAASRVRVLKPKPVRTSP